MMKIVFLGDFLGGGNVFLLSGTKSVAKALEIKTTWGKRVYSGLTQNSASFWQSYSQTFFRDHLLLKQQVTDVQ